MSDPVQVEIDAYIRRFQRSLAPLPGDIRAHYAEAVRSRLVAEYEWGKQEQLEAGLPDAEFRAGFIASLKAAWPFALTGLISRGGLSNWVFFFLPKELLMLDLGAGPALKAGARAGLAANPLLSLLGAAGSAKHGPQQARDERFDDWQAKLRSRAKAVQIARDDQVLGVRLHLRALAHQIIIDELGTTRRFQLMNRDEAETLIEPLAQRYGSRFKVTTTPVFAFCRRYAPFLMS